jgi:Uma2 family endonuclease
VIAPKLPSSPAIDPALYAELCALPAHQVGEIINGRVVASPRPASPHSLAASTIGHGLGGPFQLGRGGPGGWWILSEPELHLGESVLVPELAGWRRERMPQVPRVAAFTLAPDWVLEVISPRTAGLDRVEKLPQYAKAGVEFAWLVDPRSQVLEVYKRAGTLWTLIQAFQGHSLVRAEPFDAIELNLGDLWIPGEDAD